MTETTPESSEPDQQADAEDYHPSTQQLVLRASNWAGIFRLRPFSISALQSTGLASDWQHCGKTAVVIHPL